MTEKYIYIVMRLFAIIVGLLLLSLSIDINQRRQHKNLKTLSSIYYVLFVGVFAIVTSILEFSKVFISFLHTPFLPLILDVLNLIFTFSASITLVYITGLHSCANYDYVRSIKVFLVSKGMCREFQSLTYLSLILFYMYVISSIISGFYFGKKRNNGSGNRV
ncbi:hypothetical protein PCANB_003104 [Pneumocystis canis]|nr:hypothetical protein PCK1_003051 [Pneumocystis canis]KAG5438253.1 hypothetical protein PCANB_003104 [Pneumocystis canis]